MVMHFYMLHMSMEDKAICNFNAFLIVDMNSSGLVL
jgi:hypothetical protein